MNKQISEATDRAKQSLRKLKVKINSQVFTVQFLRDSSIHFQYKVLYIVLQVFVFMLLLSLSAKNSGRQHQNIRSDFNASGQVKTSIVVAEEVSVEPAEEFLPTNTPWPTSVPVTPTPGWWSYPENIQVVTKSGDDFLVLVNKQYKLPSTYSPPRLVPVSSAGIRTTGDYYVRDVVITDLTKLGQAAKTDGIDLSIISGYRSYSTQESTYNYWINYNGGDVAEADKISAWAGHSQHQLGTVVDFSSSEIGDRVGVEFHSTQSASWLANNAWKYGFIISYPQGYETTTGYDYESWHYRYIGVDNAATQHNSGLILELWLREQNGM